MVIRRAGRTMRSLITAAKHRIKALRTQSSDARVALEKLADDTARTQADFHAELVAIEESFEVMNARVESGKREFETEVEKKQQFLNERQETSQTASCPLAENGASFRELPLKVAAMTAERNEWYNVATKALGKLKMTEADVALQSTPREAALEEKDTHTAEIAKLQVQLAARGAEVSQLSAKHSEPTNDMNRAKAQIAAESTMLYD